MKTGEASERFVSLESMLSTSSASGALSLMYLQILPLALKNDCTWHTSRNIQASISCSSSCIRALCATSVIGDQWPQSGSLTIRDLRYAAPSSTRIKKSTKGSTTSLWSRASSSTPNMTTIGHLKRCSEGTSSKPPSAVDAASLDSVAIPRDVIAEWAVCASANVQGSKIKPSRYRRKR